MKLSCDDLGFFFEDHHFRLADELREIGARFTGLSHRAVAEELGALGLYGHVASEPADVRSLCLIREALAYHSPLADAIFAVHGLGTYPLALCGGQSERLAQARTGELIGAFALTEAEAGSDVASMETTARLESGVYLLSGTKTLISNVGIADHYVVFANANPELGKKGITAFLVEAGRGELIETPISLNVDHPIGEIHMDSCPGMLLGELGKGLRVALGTLDTFRVTVGAAAVGMARRALDEALAQVKSRVQFGAALSEQQLVQGYLAEMKTELDAARLLVLRAARVRDDGAKRTTLEAAEAKLYATEAAQRIIDRAVQLFGGRGVRSGEVVENLYRSIRPLRIYEGTSEIQKVIIARQLLAEASSE